MLTVADKRLRKWQILYLTGILIVSAPYLVAFAAQLCSDDFILIYYYGKRSPLKFWTFFYPKTIWTYHPLQHYFFSICWHLSGIEPWSYRAMSLGLHVATALLLMKFARDLSGSIHVGGLTAILFAGYWRPWEAVMWAASAATLESTFFAALVCTSFLSFLQYRRRSSYALMMLAGIGWCLSKETCVQWPLFLGAIYLYHRWRGSNESPAGGGKRQEEAKDNGRSRPAIQRPWWLEATLFLALPAVLVLVYIVFRLRMVEDIYPLSRTAYNDLIAPWQTWPKHIPKWLDRTLNPLLENEIVKALGLTKALAWIARKHLVSLGLLILALYFAIGRRRMLPLFALVLTLVSTIPYFILRLSYFVSRYHYSVAWAGSILAVALGAELWRLTVGYRGGWRSWLRVLVASLGGLWVVASLFLLTFHALEERRENRPARQLYDFFASQTDKADRRVLFVMDTHVATHSTSLELGWGMLECARVALNTDNVAAVELGFDLPARVVAQFDRYPEKYLVRVEEGKWTVTRLPKDKHLTISSGEDRGVALEE